MARKQRCHDDVSCLAPRTQDPKEEGAVGPLLTVLKTILDLQANTRERDLDIGNNLELFRVVDSPLQQNKFVDKVQGSNETRGNQ
jgi:hypothetical protein